MATPGVITSFRERRYYWRNIVCAILILAICLMILPPNVEALVAAVGIGFIGAGFWAILWKRWGIAGDRLWSPILFFFGFALQPYF